MSNEFLVFKNMHYLVNSMTRYCTVPDLFRKVVHNEVVPS
jgi:hypothetical protein